MTIDLTPAPVLQELIDDLETKICKLTTELAMLEGEVAPRYLVHGIEKQIDVLEEVLERVEAQQELIDLKQNSIILNKTYSELEDNIFETFKAENIEKEKVKISRYADIRYYGQEHTIKIPVNNKDFNEKQVKNIESQFIEKHNKEYDFKLPDNPVEIVNLHSIGEFKVEKPSLQITTEKNKTLKQAYLGEREVYLSKYNEFRRIPIYKREKLPQRTLIKGPIIIEENTSTIVVTEQFSAKYLDHLEKKIVLPKRPK